MACQLKVSDLTDQRTLAESTDAIIDDTTEKGVALLDRPQQWVTNITVSHLDLPVGPINCKFLSCILICWEPSFVFDEPIPASPQSVCIYAMAMNPVPSRSFVAS